MSLYVGTHKRTKLPNSDWIMPIGLNGYKDENVLISDSDGGPANSISWKNKNYCELTGLYWLWKNSKDDILGLCHYRRFFSFNHYNGVGYNYPSFLKIDEEDVALEFVASESQKNCMIKILDSYDVIVPRPIIHPETVSVAFIHAHGQDIWNIFLKACRKEFGYDLGYFECETRFYFGNMFVANNDFFRSYCDSLFRVIGDVFDEIGDLPEESGVRYQKYRYPGYLAERFMGFYLYKNRPKYFEVPTIWLP
jgi:hypothetical protein